MPEENSISERISELINTFTGGNKTRFASIVGTSEANIRNYVDNGVIPKYDFIKSICENFEINCEWLILGKGKMLKEENATIDQTNTTILPDLKPLAELIDKMHSEVKDLTQQLTQQLAENQVIQNENNNLKIENEKLRQRDNDSSRHNIHSNPVSLVAEKESDYKKTKQ